MQCDTGLAYYFGNGVEQSFEASAHWFHLAAEKGHTEAQYNLGNRLLSLRLSRPLNIEYNNMHISYSGLHIYTVRYCIICNSTVGVQLRDGKGVAVNHEKATHWYFLAAQQNHPRAQNNLGK